MLWQDTLREEPVDEPRTKRAEVAVACRPPPPPPQNFEHYLEGSGFIRHLHVHNISSAFVLWTVLTDLPTVSFHTKLFPGQWGLVRLVVPKLEWTGKVTVEGATFEIFSDSYDHLTRMYTVKSHSS